MATSELSSADTMVFKQYLTSPFDLNSLNHRGDTGVYCIRTGITNAPAEYCFMLNMVRNADHICQVCFSSDYIYVRDRSGSPASWGTWKRVAVTAYSTT